MSCNELSVCIWSLGLQGASSETGTILPKTSASLGKIVLFELRPITSQGETMGKKKQQTPEADKTPRQKTLDKISNARNGARWSKFMATVCMLGTVGSGKEVGLGSKTTTDIDSLLNTPGAAKYILGLVLLGSATGTALNLIEANNLNSYANALDAQLQFHPDGPPPQAETSLTKEDAV